MRFLVTGGTGFIGRFVVAELRAKGHDVSVFDIAPNPAMLDELEPGLSEDVEFVAGDISDGSVIDTAAGCDGIVHLAGIMTAACAADPLLGARINVIGSLQVFEAARRHAIRRIAYVSSAGVFGPDDGIHPRPMTHYGAQKLAVEGTARAYLRDHGIPSTGFRPFIVYGPGQSSGVAAGPSIACAAAMRGEPATIRFSGRVGFVHVRDVARLMVAAVLEAPDTAEAHTLCGETAEMEAFVDLLAAEVPGAATRIDGPPLPIPGDLATSDLPPHLALVPVTSLREGVTSTLDFYRSRGAGQNEGSVQ